MRGVGRFGCEDEAREFGRFAQRAQDLHHLRGDFNLMILGRMFWLTMSTNRAYDYLHD